MDYLQHRLNELGWSEFLVHALGREYPIFAKTAYSAVVTMAWQIFPQRASDISVREVNGLFIVSVRSEHGTREYDFTVLSAVYQARLL